jgi:acetyl esterase/lipase
VAVLIHGGFWKATYDRSYTAPLGCDLVGRGYAVWNLEYRRIGEPGGGWPGTLLDTAAAIDQLALIGAPTGSSAATLPEGARLDLTRVVTIGHSAGGQLALWLAARARLLSPIGGMPAVPITAAVALAGVLDLHAADRQLLGATEAETSASLCPTGAVAALLGGRADEVPERYRLASPRHLLPLGVPMVLVHGEADHDVPVKQSRTYAAAARAVGDTIELIEFPGADHFDVVDPQGPAWCTAMDRLTVVVGEHAETLRRNAIR